MINEFFIKNAMAILFAVISFISIYAVNNYRLSNLEDRQDRQGTAIAALQSQQTDMMSNFARLDEKMNALNDNMLYIRNKIDAAIK